MQAILLYIYVTVRSYLAWFWLRLCRWVQQPARAILPTSEYRHKIVIIGDGFAAGYGDYITFDSPGGLAKYLRAAMSQDAKIRHNWQVLNCGIVDTDSSQWTPMASTKYFHDIFSKAEYKDADIVLVMVGSMDATRTPPIAPEETLRNLKSIADALTKKGKRVALAPLCHCDLAAQNDVHVAASKLIRDFCTDTQHDDLPVVCGPNLALPMVRRPEAKAFDGFHFNSSAYKQIAQDAMDVVQPMATAVEWTTWKKKLDGVHIDPALYE
ncbi:hypothetical protein ACHHYP_00421 [Achlya hypogyna]|uniref:SGNH hydrolase-type esterase domain-containing protein n=1 Tax=Achlya hypogyna TaxID=1202772 RepID=A0A1V9ZUG2_ACHHY|nr:hypothetical protein ACHHYP_00421 [Achlya hypogyna]